METLNTKNLKTEKGYFRGEKRFGRTTKLIRVDENGEYAETLIEVMGVATKKDLLRNLRIYSETKKNQNSY